MVSAFVYTLPSVIVPGGVCVHTYYITHAWASPVRSFHRRELGLVRGPTLALALALVLAFALRLALCAGDHSSQRHFACGYNVIMAYVTRLHGL